MTFEYGLEWLTCSEAARTSGIACSTADRTTGRACWTALCTAGNCSRATVTAVCTKGTAVCTAVCTTGMARRRNSEVKFRPKSRARLAVLIVSFKILNHVLYVFILYNTCRKTGLFEKKRMLGKATVIVDQSKRVKIMPNNLELLRM